MKRFLCILTLTAALLLAACGSASEPETPVIAFPEGGHVIAARIVGLWEDEVLLAGLKPPYAGVYAVEPQAMLDAAAEAGRAKCNCYKTDAASVESCIKSILTQSYAAYEGNEEFKTAMEAEYQNCIKEKATAAAKDVANQGIKEGAKALSNALNQKN